MTERVDQADQRRMLELQQIDLAIRRLEHRRRELPEQHQLDEAERTRATLAEEHAAGQQRLEELQRQQRKLERDVGDVESRRKTEEARMYSGQLHTEREVGAVRAEIGDLKRRKADLEDEMLEVMEELEELESSTVAQHERIEQLAGEIDQLTAARDEVAGGIDAELAEQRELREAKVAEISEQAAALYERVSAKRDGVAVAALQGSTCTGCRLELTVVQQEEVRDRHEAGELSWCEQCDRILVIGS